LQGVRVACAGGPGSHYFPDATKFAVEAETDILYIYRDQKNIACFKTWDNVRYVETRTS
jgi:hypothetical protein